MERQKYNESKQVVGKNINQQNFDNRKNQETAKVTENTREAQIVDKDNLENRNGLSSEDYEGKSEDLQRFIKSQVGSCSAFPALTL